MPRTATNKGVNIGDWLFGKGSLFGGGDVSTPRTGMGTPNAQGGVSSATGRSFNPTKPGVSGQYQSNPQDFQAAQQTWDAMTGSLSDVEKRNLSREFGADPYTAPGFGGVADALASQMGWNSRDAATNSDAIAAFLQDYGVGMGLKDNFWDTQKTQYIQGVPQKATTSAGSLPAAGVQAGTLGSNGKPITIKGTGTKTTTASPEAAIAEKVANQKQWRSAVETEFNNVVAGLDENQIGDVIRELGGNPYSPDPMKDLMGFLIKDNKLKNVQGQDLVDTLGRIIRGEGAKARAKLFPPDPVTETFGDGQGIQFILDQLSQMMDSFGQTGGTTTATPDFTQALLDAFGGKTYES